MSSFDLFSTCWLFRLYVVQTLESISDFYVVEESLAFLSLETVTYRLEKYSPSERGYHPFPLGHENAKRDDGEVDWVSNLIRILAVWSLSEGNGNRKKWKYRMMKKWNVALLKFMCSADCRRCHFAYSIFYPPRILGALMNFIDTRLPLVALWRSGKFAFDARWEYAETRYKIWF